MKGFRHRLLFVLWLSAWPLWAGAETLAELYELALANDPALKAAHAAWLAGRESAAIARAALLPQISASAEYAESDNDATRSSVFVLGGVAVPSFTDRSTETDATTFAVSLRQPIFDLPAWYDWRQGRTVAERTRLELLAAQQDLVMRVADAYFAVLRAADNLASALAEEQALSRQLEQTRQRYEVGLVPITDVHEAQASRDAAAANTLHFRGALKTAFEALAVLTGRSHEALVPLADDFPTPPPEGSAEDWVALATAHNLELRIARLGEEAARYHAQARKYEHLPRLAGTLSWQDVDQDATFDDNTTSLRDADEKLDSETTAAALTLSMPLFSGGLISAQRRQALHQHVEAEERAELALRNTILEARSAWQELATQAAVVAARRQAITSAESALEATRAGYEVGTRNIVDLLFAERNLHQARRDYANARYDYVAANLALKKVAGQLSPEDLYALDRWLESGQAVRPEGGPAVKPEG
ncbi:MAG: hypothetical protein KatS3mg124_2309 [Porticoccaceae bacterium]|nr:MAG: hypothetical protein KatS3mg124_2309 [Porticoccaceae bacterium]